MAPSNERLCRCDRGPEADWCELCGAKVCLACLGCDSSPISDIEYDRVCAACRDAIWEIREALEFYRHRQAIMTGIRRMAERLEEVQGVPIGEAWGHAIGFAIGEANRLLTLYNLQPQEKALRR